MMTKVAEDGWNFNETVETTYALSLLVGARLLRRRWRCGGGFLVFDVGCNGMF